MQNDGTHLVSLSFAHPAISAVERAALLEAVPHPRDALLAASAHVEEALLLSTCLRVELVAITAEPDHAWAALRAASHRALPSEGALRVDADALHHLIRVAAGLESAVPGEPEVLGQVRRALDHARDAGTAGLTLTRALDGVIASARRVRRALGPVGSGSLATLAAGAVEAAIAPGERVAVIGTGPMGEAAARRLGQRYEVVRAGRRDGLLPITSVPAELPLFAAVVSATGSRRALFALDELAPVCTGRDVLLVDLAVPADFPEGVGDLPGVRYVGVDELVAVRPPDDHEVVDELARDEATCLAARLARPTPARTAQALERRARAAADEELARTLTRLPGLDADQQAEIARLAHRLAGRLLHAPLRALGTGTVDEAAAAQLFDLQ